ICSESPAIELGGNAAAAEIRPCTPGDGRCRDGQPPLVSFTTRHHENIQLGFCRSRSHDPPPDNKQGESSNAPVLVDVWQVKRLPSHHRIPCVNDGPTPHHWP